MKRGPLEHVLGERTKRFLVKGWPGLRVYVEKVGPREYKAESMLVVCDVEDGLPITVGREVIHEVPEGARPTARVFAGWAKEVLLESLAHELNECMVIDGKKAFPNPHAKKKRRKR